MTDLLLGELERELASSRLHRVFRRKQPYCPTRREGDLGHAALACGTVIVLVNAIPGRQLECRLAPVLVRAGHTALAARGHNTMVVFPPLASVVQKNHSISGCLGLFRSGIVLRSGVESWRQRSLHRFGVNGSGDMPMPDSWQSADYVALGKL
jgi:hypothetical protein